MSTDETKIQWLYPPNFSGTYDETDELDAVKGHRRHIVHCTYYAADTEGFTDNIQIKRKDLRTVFGNIPSKLIIDKIEWDVQGLTLIISYNNINDEEVKVLYTGQGVVDYSRFGGFVPEDDGTTVANDDYAGDIVFTVNNVAAADSYDVVLHVRTHE